MENTNAIRKYFEQQYMRLDDVFTADEIAKNVLPHADELEVMAALWQCEALCWIKPVDHRLIFMDRMRRFRVVFSA